MKAAAGALASALLFGLAARLEWYSPAAALVALAPWLAALEGASAGAALASAALAAIGVTACAFFWLPPAIAAYTGLSPIAAWTCTLALAPILFQPQFLAACGCRLLARRFGGARVITALAYVGAEWALWKPLGDTIGIGLFPSAALRQTAEIGGAAALTFLCAAFAEGVAAALGRRRAAPALCAAGLLVAAAGLGELRARAVRAEERDAARWQVGVVQAAITAYDKLAAEQGTYGAVRQILDAHFALSADLLREGPVDLLVWPETVYPTTFAAPKSEDGANLDHEIAALPARSGVPLVFGAFEDTAAGEHNAAFFLAPDGSFATYRKSVLFPLTERMPRWIDFPLVRAALPWAGRWAPGPGPETVPVRLASGAQIAVAPLICYEAVDPDYVAREARAGADLLLTLSNDGWFTSAAAPRLHLAAAALRSIELRLPQVRATNSGISALILPSGDVVGATRFGEAGAVRLAVPRVRRARTPVLAWGNWLPIASALLAWAMLLYAALPLPRERAPGALQLPRHPVGNANS